jgi:hypothetical protein
MFQPCQIGFSEAEQKHVQIVGFQIGVHSLLQQIGHLIMQRAQRIEHQLSHHMRVVIRQQTLCKKEKKKKKNHFVKTKTMKQKEGKFRIHHLHRFVKHKNATRRLQRNCFFLVGLGPQLQHVSSCASVFFFKKKQKKKKKKKKLLVGSILENRKIFSPAFGMFATTNIP